MKLLAPASPELAGRASLASLAHRCSLAFIACAALIAAAPAQAAPEPGKFYRLESAWDPNFLVTTEHGDPTVDIASPAWQSADWVFEPLIPNVYLIRNRWRGTYLTLGPKQEGTGVHLATLQPKLEGLRQIAQAWLLEPVAGQADVYRIRFGMKDQNLFLNMDSGRLEVTNLKPTLASGHWKVYESSGRAAPQQCVKNMSLTVFQVEWLKAREVQWKPARFNQQSDGTWLVQIMAPSSDSGAVARKDTVSLGFSSCVRTGELMYARVSLVGKDEVAAWTNLGVIIVGGTVICMVTGPLCLMGGPVTSVVITGSAAAAPLINELSRRPNVVYRGVPGEIEIHGTLFDPSVKVVKALVK